MTMDAATLQVLVEEALASGNYEPLVEAVPYARLLGIKLEQRGEEILFTLPSDPDLIGNPVLPAIHGGVIAGFMEHAAVIHLMIFMKSAAFPKIIDFSIDYLRAGLARDTYATCQVWRQGRRVGNVAITAWQTRSNEPIATARAHFKLD